MVVSRRAVLHGVGAGAASATVLGSTPAAAVTGEQAAELTDGSRRTVALHQGWRFALVNTDGADAPKPPAHDASWHQVDLPHDWSIALDPTDEAHTTSGTGFLPGGLGWYERTFTLPRQLAGKRLSIEFDGVYMDAQVTLDGKTLAEHPYGYTGFAVDLTPHVQCDGHTRHTLAVRARNQVPSSRWYSGSGLYREVRLLVTDPVHLVRHGVTVTTPNLAHHVEEGRAHVRVRATARSTEGGLEARIAARLRDAQGRTVAEGSVPAELDAQAQSFTVDLWVSDPELWSPSRPYRYTLETRIEHGTKTLDATRLHCGLRWFTFDPAAGFSLNGHRTKLHGVNLHHDLGALGAAFSRDAARRQLRLMQQMGVNAVRTSHNPPAPDFVDLCDEEGVLLQIEAFDCWRTPKNPHDYGRFFDTHAEDDIAEMVHAAKNSPAVVMWSLGNEIPDNTEEAGVAMAQRLIRAVKDVDATRPLVMGSHVYRELPTDGSPEDRILRLLDGMGVNYNTAGSLDALHEKYPDTFFFESESSSNTSTRGVYDAPEQHNTGENHAPGHRGASSYDNNQAEWTMSGEHSLKKERDRPYMAGQFVWTGIDYIGEPTPYDVYPVKTSFFGAVDTAGFPKDQFSLYQSQWSTEPMVHLVPMDWTRHRPGEEVQVWAYSNVETVELLLNGRSLGKRSFESKTAPDGHTYLETTEEPEDDKTVTDGPHPGSYTSPNGSAGRLHLTWRVPFEKGRLEAVARRDGRVVARDVLRTAGEPAALRLHVEDRQVAARGLAFVHAEVTDARGVRVPGAEDAVTFSVNGGTLRGTDNGRQESAENYTSATRKTLGGLALAVVQAQAGADVVSVTGRAPGLHTDTVTVRTEGTGARMWPRATAPLPTSNTAPTETASAVSGPRADAGYAGSEETLPAAMVDGSAHTGWSNYFNKEATPLLEEESTARPREWISLSWDDSRRVAELRVRFTRNSRYALPKSVAVSYWNGQAHVPVDGLQIDWASASDGDTRFTFEEVTTRHLKLEMTSRHPGTARGFLRIVSLSAAEV